MTSVEEGRAVDDMQAASPRRAGSVDSYEFDRGRMRELMAGKKPVAVARRIGCSETALNNWLNGQTRPGCCALAALASELGVAMEDLVRRI